MAAGETLLLAANLVRRSGSRQNGPDQWLSRHIGADVGLSAVADQCEAGGADEAPGLLAPEFEFDVDVSLVKIGQRPMFPGQFGFNVA